MMCYNLDEAIYMYKVLKNELIKENIYELDIEAPLVVNKCLPGQFVIVMALESSERIPLTIYDYNREKGILKIIYQVVGASTLELTEVKKELFSVTGPLGNPSELIINIDKLKDMSVIFIAGGVGISAVYPHIKYLHEHNVDIDCIYGAKSSNYLILEDEIKKMCNNLYIATDDGSKGFKGLVTDCLKSLDKHYDKCLAIGPVTMMKYVSLVTKDLNIPTVVSMNPIMIDGTGMCGSCRLMIDEKVKFACVDGPEFDGHKVDFDSAIKRMNLYKTFEGRKYLEKQEGRTHHGNCGNCGGK